MSGTREAMWAAVRALSARSADEAELSPRALRLARGRGVEVAFGDLSQTPAWAMRPPEERQRLARLVGAAGSALAWRRTVDGPTLRAAAEALGEPALDAVLAIPEALTPSIAGSAATAEELEAKGAATLLADAPPVLRDRLRNLLPTMSAALAIGSADAKAARDAAEALMLQLGAEV